MFSLGSEKFKVKKNYLHNYKYLKNVNLIFYIHIFSSYQLEVFLIQVLLFTVLPAHGIHCIGVQLIVYIVFYCKYVKAILFSNI